ncbi:MAG TPA: ABC transporter ATP-binding protein [Candidatus Methylomirabilis sp.]|nr:ABC transporter ATP-binding protein [Candidatus Methylomirabilis sp.]
MALCEAVRLTKRFGGVTALEDVTLSLEPATIVALIGPNGSGKTTLFHLLGGQLRPTTGAIRWRDREITRWPPHRRCRAGINRTFQVALPFPDFTLAENVALGILYGAHGEPAHTRGDALVVARDLLAGVGLGEMAPRAARSLSLGELKRLELAMALATRPALILLDELLSGQSPAAAQDLLGYLTRLRADGLSICLIEHRLQALLPVADRVVALQQGKIIAEGKPEAVVRNPRVLEAYLGEPAP